MSVFDYSSNEEFRSVPKLIKRHFFSIWKSVGVFFSFSLVFVVKSFLWLNVYSRKKYSVSFIHNIKLTPFSQCENLLKYGEFHELQGFLILQIIPFQPWYVFTWSTFTWFKSIHLKNLMRCTLYYQEAAFIAWL